MKRRVWSVSRTCALAAAFALAGVSSTACGQGQAPAPQKPAPAQAPAQKPAAGGHAAPQYTGPLPPIRVVPTEANFGIANPDYPIHTKVSVTNTSPKSIRIVEVRPTCKCTVPTLPKNILESGETIDISLVLDLRGSLGDVKKPFDIFVEGWNRPFTAVVAGKLQYPILVSPDQPQATPKRKGEIRLTSADGRPFKVISVHGRAPQVVQRTPTDGEQATDWTIQWDLSHVPTWPYMLVLETDHPECKVFTVRLWGQAVSDPEVEFIKNWREIFVNRMNVNLGIIPAGGSAEFDVPIARPKHDSPCTLSFFEDRVDTTSPDGLKLELIEAKPVDGKATDETYRIRVINTSPVRRTVCVPVYFSTINSDPASVANPNGGKVRSPGEFLGRCWIGGVLDGPTGS